MRFYFTTNDKWYSKAHRLIGDEPFTHVGLGFFHDSLKLVIDCTKPSGKLYHENYWFSKYELCVVLEVPLHAAAERSWCVKVANACVNAEYDWGAYYYFWLMGLRKFLFGKKPPDHNPWARRKYMWCTEIVEPIKADLFTRGIDIVDLDLTAATPYMLYQKLKETPAFKESDVACGKTKDRD